MTAMAQEQDVANARAAELTPEECASIQDFFDAIYPDSGVVMTEEMFQESYRKFLNGRGEDLIKRRHERYIDWWINTGFFRHLAREYIARELRRSC